MDVLLLGCGSVGSVVADHLRALGHVVIGTTTTPDRVAVVQRHCDRTVVVRGDDEPGIAELVAEVDAVVSCVSPPERRAMTAEERRATYRTALVDTARSVVACAGDRPVVAISSLSVLGRADGHDEVDEDTPLPELDDPSPAAYAEMERTYLDGPGGRASLLRTGDIVSPGDPTLQDKVSLAHQHLAGSVPFDDRALAYRVTAGQVAEVVVAVLDAGPQGVVHVVPSEVPPTNAELYGRACDRAGLPALGFRRELATPLVPVRASRLAALGIILARV